MMHSHQTFQVQENLMCKRRRFDHARRDSEGRRAEHRAGHQGVPCLHLRVPAIASLGALFCVAVHRRPEADTVAETGTAWIVAGRGAAGGGEVPQQPWHQAALTAGFVWCLRSWPASRRARWVRTSTRSPKALSPASWTSRSVSTIPFSLFVVHDGQRVRESEFSGVCDVHRRANDSSLFKNSAVCPTCDNHVHRPPTPSSCRHPPRVPTSTTLLRSSSLSNARARSGVAVRPVRRYA